MIAVRRSTPTRICAIWSSTSCTHINAFARVSLSLLLLLFSLFSCASLFFSSSIQLASSSLSLSLSLRFPSSSLPSSLFSSCLHPSRIAGRDTTASTLTWLFFCLARNPQKLEKVLEEMRANKLLSSQQNSAADLPGYENAKNLTYLKACIDETLRSIAQEQTEKTSLTKPFRLYPPVPIDTKYCSEPDLLPNGHTVPRGATIVWSAWVMGRLPEYWDQPEEFRPERW